MWYIRTSFKAQIGAKVNTLFESNSINTMSLSNRFIRSATWEGLADDEGKCSSRLVELMSKLAKGGVGLIITGHTYVHQNGRHSPWQLGIDRDELIPSLKSMTGAVHEAGGKIAVQLGYGGAYLSKSRVRSMSIAAMQELVDAFGQAAIRAKEAKFDAVQIFAAHGFFLSQLLCPRYNDRTDSYGGDIQNRARALLEVLEAVRQAVGPNYPVLIKLNAQDFVENGLSLEDAIRVGVLLEKNGIDGTGSTGRNSQVVPHGSELFADLFRHRLVDEHPARLGSVTGEGPPHLVAVDVGAFRRLLNVHVPLYHVEKKLEEVLVLAVAPLHGEGEVGLSVLECHAGGEGGPGSFAGLDDVEGVVRRIGDEALPALAQSHPGSAGDDRRDPAPAWGHRHDPPLLVRSLDGGGTGVEVLLIEGLAVHPILSVHCPQ